MTPQPVVLALILAAISPQQVEPAKPSTDLAHVSNTFHFEIRAPLSRVAPLFGPAGERGWAGQNWNPEFLYPGSGRDIQGAVFQVQHGQHTSVWVNTLFDLAAGKMQYVAFIDEVVVTTVDVKLTSTNASRTTVEVTYARTALRRAANDDVRALGDRDRDNGPGWQKDIEKCLGLEAK
jgi:hypothetical protein